MSETTLYFALAQLNLILTAHLRLGFVFVFLGIGWRLWQQYRPGATSHTQTEDRGLSEYWLAWATAAAGLALGSALGLQYLLERQSLILYEGFYDSLGLAAAVLSAWAASVFMGKSYRSAGLITYAISLVISAYCLYTYSFSRSDKDLFGLILALPVALSLSYFPLCFRQRVPAKAFHQIFLWGLLPVLGVYYGWMYPLTRHIPQAGEFYPFINLYDWILPLFVILYLGNIYIDFWLNKRKNTLALVWNYPVVITAILCQWLNTNILDTLAL